MASEPAALTQRSEGHLTGSRAASTGLKNGGVQHTAGARETAAKNAEILSSLPMRCPYVSGQLHPTLQAGDKVACA